MTNQVVVAIHESVSIPEKVKVILDDSEKLVYLPKTSAYYWHWNDWPALGTDKRHEKLESYVCGLDDDQFALVMIQSNGYSLEMGNTILYDLGLETTIRTPFEKLND